MDQLKILQIVTAGKQTEEAPGSNDEKLHGEKPRQKCCFYCRIKLFGQIQAIWWPWEHHRMIRSGEKM